MIHVHGAILLLPRRGSSLRNTIILRCTTSSPSNDKTSSSSSPATSPPTTTLLSACSQLAKAKLSSLVVATTAAGYIAAGGDVTAATLPTLLTGTFLCSASAAACNQIWERDADALMQRTRRRPTVTGEGLSLSASKITAAVWGGSGVGLLYTAVDPVTAGWGALNIVLYAGVYTPLKRRTIYNTWVGAIVGAIPPVMGCTAAAAAAGSIDCGTATCLALTLYHWQLVHFLALSHMYRVDYTRGGFVMLGGQDTAATAASMLRNAYGLALLPPALAYATGATSAMYVVESVVLNAYTVYLCHKFQEDSSNQKARRVFMNSLWYLPCSLILFCWHSRGLQARLDGPEKEEENMNLLQSLRDWGRRHCLHEQQAVHETCPVAHDAPVAALEAATEATLLKKKATSGSAVSSSS